MTDVDPLTDELDLRPTIRIRAPELDRMVNEAIAALAAHDDNLYQRTGELVTIIREPDRVEPNCGERLTQSVACPTCRAPASVPCARDYRVGDNVQMRPGTPRLRSLSPPVLLRKMSVVARWERFDPRAKMVVHAPPPSSVASIIHAPDQEKPGVKPIRGILESPSMRPDWSVIDRTGYDAATGYVLLPSCVFPPIPAEPTQAEAAAALERLWVELFCDFPFAGLGEVATDWRETDGNRHAQYERARALADAFVGIGAFLTVIVRPAILGAVPGIIFEAASQGSGKTLQIHALSVAATSRPAGVMTFPANRGEANEEELEKVLAAYAMAGARVVAFDNVKCSIGGPALEKALTSVDTIDLRVLGSTEIRTMPWSAVTIFSGNNLTMNDDVAQRVLVSRLESPREDPRSRPARDFMRPDLLASILEKRPQLVVDALTVLRAFVVAAPDKRPDTGTWGSFEAWSRLIPPAIAYAGGPNILDARPKAGSDSGDADADAHLTLMRQWPCPERTKSSELLRIIFPDTESDQVRGKVAPDGRDEVRAAVRTLARTGEGRVPNGTAFGKLLGKLRGKPRGGLKIVGEDNRIRVKEWWVANLASTSASPPALAVLGDYEDEADERSALQSL